MLSVLYLYNTFKKRKGQDTMYYKIIVYEKKFLNVETAKGFKKVIYFNKLATYHDIPKATLSKKYIETWAKWCDTRYHITTILETEQDDLILKYNEKARKYNTLIA